METTTSTLFEILGCRIRLHASWLLVAALAIWSLTSGVLPKELPGLARPDYVALSLAAVLGLFASLILHELAHALMARQFGLGVGTVTLFVFGGVADLDDAPVSPKSEVWVAMAGPAASVGLAGLACLGLYLTGGTQQSQVLAALMRYLLSVNLLLAAVNLVPGYPLDGGRVLRAALWHQWTDLVRATRVATGVGQAVAGLLVAAGFVALFSGDRFGGVWPVLTGLFLMSAARSSYQRLLVRQALAGKTIGAMMTRAPWTTGPDQTLADLVDTVMLAHAVSFVPVCEGDHVLGHIDGRAVSRIDRENWSTTHVADVFTETGSDTAIPPDLPTEVLLQKIMRGGPRKFMVVQQRRLLGVITLSDLRGYLSVLHDPGGSGAPPWCPEQRQKP